MCTCRHSFFVRFRIIGSVGNSVPVAESYAVSSRIGRLMLGGTRGSHIIGEDHSGQVLA